MSGQSIGSKVIVEYRRDGKTGTVEMKLAELPAPDSRGVPEGATMGISLQTLTEPLARSLGVDPNLRGAVIAEVRPDSPAARAGLQPGDIIREVNGKPVASAEEAVAAIRSAGKKRQLLRVTNAAGTKFVTVTPE
ncbi:MAG: PDZ domain-containing protein [Opitutaceae bacterium]